MVEAVLLVTIFPYRALSCKAAPPSKILETGRTHDDRGREPLQSTLKEIPRSGRRGMPIEQDAVLDPLMILMKRPSPRRELTSSILLVSASVRVGGKTPSLPIGPGSQEVYD